MFNTTKHFTQSVLVIFESEWLGLRNWLDLSEKLHTKMKKGNSK